MDWLVRDGEWDNAEIGVPHLDQHAETEWQREAYRARIEGQNWT